MCHRLIGFRAERFHPGGCVDDVAPGQHRRERGEGGRVREGGAEREIMKIEKTGPVAAEVVTPGLR